MLIQFKRWIHVYYLSPLNGIKMFCFSNLLSFWNVCDTDFWNHYHIEYDMACIFWIRPHCFYCPVLLRISGFLPVWLVFLEPCTFASSYHDILELIFFSLSVGSDINVLKAHARVYEIIIKEVFYCLFYIFNCF